MVDKEEQVRLRQLAEQRKIASSTIVSRKNASLKDFLRKKDPQLDNLKKQYFESDKHKADKNSAYQP